MKMFKWMNAALAAVLAFGMAAATAPTAEAAEKPFTISAEETELVEYEVTKGGYTYKDYYGGETKVDLYTVLIHAGDEEVDLAFTADRLVYNYDVDGETYLDGWYDDATVGSKTATVAVDSDDNGVYDIIQVQKPYTVDEEGNWNDGDLLYAITFTSGNNTTDMNYTISADGVKLSNPTVTKDGYTYQDYYAGEVKVDLYTYEVFKGTESVDLEFTSRRLVYNYDPNGVDWLDGWYDDAEFGSRSKHVEIDANKDGAADVLQVQNTYNMSDYSEGQLLYAITFKYVDPLKAPANVKVATNVNGLKITWDKVKGASKYSIYRKTGSGSYKRIRTTSKLEYVNEDLTNGSKYTYYVKALNKSGQKGEISKKVVKYYLKRPAISDLASKTAGKLTVKYGKNSKATGYKICYARTKDFADSTTVTVKDPATVSKTISSLTKGKRYYVKVRAYKTVDSKTYYSAWSAYKSVTIKK